MAWELELLLWIQNLGIYDILSKIMLGITKLGDQGFIWVCLIAFLFFYKKDKSKAICALFALICVAVFGNLILKNIFARPRPFVVYPYIDVLVHAGGYSFPSGHSASSFAVASVLGYFYPKKAKYLYTLAFLIAISRMVLFVHFPTDIMMGILLGIGVGNFAIKAYQNQWFSKFD